MSKHSVSHVIGWLDRNLDAFTSHKKEAAETKQGKDYCLDETELWSESEALL